MGEENSRLGPIEKEKRFAEESLQIQREAQCHGVRGCRRFVQKEARSREKATWSTAIQRTRWGSKESKTQLCSSKQVFFLGLY